MILHQLSFSREPHESIPEFLEKVNQITTQLPFFFEADIVVFSTQDKSEDYSLEITVFPLLECSQGFLLRLYCSACGGTIFADFVSAKNPKVRKNMQVRTVSDPFTFAQIN